MAEPGVPLSQDVSARFVAWPVIACVSWQYLNSYCELVCLVVEATIHKFHALKEVDLESEARKGDDKHVNQRRGKHTNSFDSTPTASATDHTCITNGRCCSVLCQSALTRELPAAFLQLYDESCLASCANVPQS
jgi:hypothetical protein